MKLTNEQLKYFAEKWEENITTMLREDGILLDGYQLRQIEDVAKKLAHVSVMKQKELEACKVPVTI